MIIIIQIIVIQIIIKIIIIQITIIMIVIYYTKNYHLNKKIERIWYNNKIIKDRVLKINKSQVNR